MRIASIGYATEQGLGHLMRDFFTAGVVTDPIIYRHGHPSRPTHADWYPPWTPVVDPRRTGLVANQQVRDILNRVDLLLAWETFFDWSLVAYCRKIGVRTVLVPMYEWTPTEWPEKPDMLICPSLLDLDIFRDQFTPGRCVHLPIPVRTDRWQLRTTARNYLHNAGNVGHREHKGTRQLLESVKYLTQPIDLVVRAQDETALRSIVSDVFGPEIASANPAVLPAGGGARVRVEYGAVPYANLWNGRDVYVAPEKFNGLSLPLQEARAAGLLVMTTNRYPANTWLPEEALIPVAHIERARIGGGYYEFDESVVDPRVIATVMDTWFNWDIVKYSLSGREWAEANSWGVLKASWLEALGSCLPPGRVACH